MSDFSLWLKLNETKTYAALSLALVFNLSSFWADAQTSCGTAAFLEPNATIQLEYNGSGEHWLFSENQGVGTQILLENDEMLEIDSMAVYNDNCGSLNLLGISYPAYGDLGLSFYTNNLGANEVFYIQIFSSAGQAGHPFNITVMSSTTPSWCQTLGNCDFICNPSFENSTSGSFPDPWFINSYTPDYIYGSPHPNMNTSARTGSGMTGLITYYHNVGHPMEREGISIPLHNTINKGEWIYGEMYVKWGDHASSFVNQGLNEIGQTDYLEMLFTNGPFNMSPTLPQNGPAAQITPINSNGVSSIGWIDQSGWKKISGVFEVQSNSVDHLTISNFRDDAFSANHLNDPNTEFAYVLVDDVNVESLPGAGSISGTVCPGNQVQLGTGSCNHQNMSVSWSPTTGLSAPNIPNPTATVTQTTTYTITVTYSNITYTDQITINVSDIPDVVTLNDDCNGSNRSVSFTIPNYNSNNSYTMQTATGFTYGSFSQNGSNITISDISYTNFKNTGEFTISVSSPGNTGCTFSGTIFKCCNGGDIAAAREASSDRTDVTNWSNKNVEVGDYLEFDEDLTIQNSTFYMHPDAQLRIRGDAVVTFDNCEFKPADCTPTYRWDGIIVIDRQIPAPGLLFIDNSRIDDSYRGVFSEEKAMAIKLTGNTFRDNMMSFTLMGHDNSWNNTFANNTQYYITGNHFEHEAPHLQGIQSHPSSNLDIQDYLPNANFGSSTYGPVLTNPSIHVLVDDVDPFILGDANANANTFTKDPIANSFTNLNGGSHLLASNSSIELFNNEFISKDPHVALVNSKAIIGNTGNNEANTFDAVFSEDFRGIHAIESSFDCRGNKFKRSASIYGKNLTKAEVDLGDPDWHGYGTRIRQNTFRGGSEINSQGTEELRSGEIYITNSNTNPVVDHPPLKIIHNAFHNSSRIKLENFKEPAVVAPGLNEEPARIYGNGFHGEGFTETSIYEDNAFISVLNSKEVKIYENNMDCSQPNETGPIEDPTYGKAASASSSRNYFCTSGVGMYIQDCEDCEIKGNGNSPEPPISTNEPVKIGDTRALYLTGTLTGTKLHCNVLDSNNRHIFFDYARDVADQGNSSLGADNEFLNVLVPGHDISGDILLPGNSNSGAAIDYYRDQGGNRTPSTQIGAGSITVRFGQPNSCNLMPKSKAVVPKTQKSELAYLELYPNPTKDRLRISTSQPGQRAVIRTVSGKMIVVRNIKKEVTVLPVSELPPGVYLLQYGRETRKFVIAR